MKSIDKTNKLNSRDLISLGIFNAIAVIGYLIVTAVACSTGIGLFVSTAAAFLVLGVVYMLMAVKVKKRGVFIICGVLLAIVGLIKGHIYTSIGSILGGLLAELIAGKYGSTKRIVAAYLAFTFSDFVGTFLPTFLLGAEYFISRAAKFGMGSYAAYFTAGPVFFAILAVVNLLCAFLGALIGIRILKKHFKKAGMIG